MAYDLKKEEDVKDYLNNLGTEYKFGCYSEKKPEVCHLLGDYYEGIVKDFAKAVKVYKSTCDDYKYNRSCHSYATYALLGKGLPEKNPEQAFEYFEKACSLGKSESCSNAGMMAVTGDPARSKLINYNKGIELLDKGCTMGSPVACYYLSGLYLAGRKTVAKDMKLAAKYATRGCDLNDIYCCSNLSIMYRKGDGVDQDISKAEDLQKKTKELERQHNDTLTVNFQRGPNN